MLKARKRRHNVTILFEISSEAHQVNESYSACPIHAKGCTLFRFGTRIFPTYIARSQQDIYVDT